MSGVETSWIGPCSGKNDLNRPHQTDWTYMPIASISYRWRDDERQSERLEADGQRGRRGGGGVSRTSIIGGGEMMRDSQCEGWMEQKTDDEVERGNKRGRTSERENRPRCPGCQRQEVVPRWLAEKEPTVDKCGKMWVDWCKFPDSLLMHVSTRAPLFFLYTERGADTFSLQKDLSLCLREEKRVL